MTRNETWAFFILSVISIYSVGSNLYSLMSFQVTNTMDQMQTLPPPAQPKPQNEQKPLNTFEKSHSKKGNDATTKSTNEKLEFIHITKTAGTSIEQMAAGAGIAWGACKFFIYPHCRGLKPINHGKYSKWECYNSEIRPWHCPPMKFRLGINLYRDLKTFAIVRNPYDRIISEYYWKRMEADRVSLENANNETDFNTWINEALDEISKNGFYYDGHCIPMHNFTHYKGKKIVDHILGLENLTTELPTLMKMYNLNLKLPRSNVRNKGARLGVTNMTNDSIRKINEWAQLDFHLFGYKMISPK